MFYQYDPADVIIVHGSALIEGFAEGSMVSITRRERDFEMDAGAKGDVCMRRMRNPIGEITVRLQAESPSNTVLAQARELAIKGLAVAVPTTVQDLRKAALHSSSFSIVQGAPDVDYAAEAGVREWVFLCADLESFVAGSFLVQ